MSGPKDYSPPPRYSMQTFDGRLNRVFQLQSRLKRLCAEVGGLKVADAKLSIAFDCRADLERLGPRITTALNPLVFDYKGSFGQDIYDRVSSEIDERIALIQKQVNACESVKADFTNRKADYESYRSYLVFYANAKVSFDDFKDRVADYLSENLSTRAPEILEEAVGRIGSVKPDLDVSRFSFGFASKSDAQKQAITEHIEEKERNVNEIRTDVSEKILSLLKTAAPPVIRSRKIADDTAIVIEKINRLIQACDDEAARTKYAGRLNRLLESESLKDIYFSRELHDSILGAENRRRLKHDVSALLSDLNSTKVHNKLEADKASLIQKSLKVLTSPAITTVEVDSLRSKLSVLIEQSNTLFEEDDIRDKERLFLKSQIVLCLENLGYEVMHDLEVIDFEKENDFLLQIREQPNYLNLKFKDDGSIRYVFQIPEDPNTLSTDRKNAKLNEMKVTCSEFKSVLDDLSKMGLQINLRSEQPVAPESLLSLPSSKRETLVRKSKKQGNRSVKKRYLAAGNQ